jgi:hypothetical protein
MMIGESPLCPADQTSSCPGSKISPSRERRGDAVTGHPSFAQGRNFRAAGHRGRQRSTSRRTSRSWPACEPGLIEPSATALWVSEATACFPSWRDQAWSTMYWHHNPCPARLWRSTARSLSTVLWESAGTTLPGAMPWIARIAARHARFWMIEARPVRAALREG